MDTDNRHVGQINGLLRVLALLLSVWEPVTFAAAAAAAFNAVSVRGLPVVVVLTARLATTAISVAAGRALLDRRAAAPGMAKLALVTSATVQLVEYLTPYFPSNRLPGQTPFYVAWTIAYYGGWLIYVIRSRRVASVYQ